jgi:hypothetical protein
VGGLIEKVMSIRKRLKLPKEHGAWAMLYVPLAAGASVAGGISWRVVLIALATTFILVARESILAWWRARSRGASNRESFRMMLVYLALAAASAAPLILISRLYWLAPLGLASVILLAVNAEQGARREDRTVTGEVIAILGLTLTAPTAYYVARREWDGVALWLWALCALYFASSVFYVKLRVHWLNRRKPQARRQALVRCALYHSFLLAGLAALAAIGSLNVFALAAFAPVLGRSFWQLLKPAAKLNLRRVGVLELVYSVVFLVFITLTFR